MADVYETARRFQELAEAGSDAALRTVLEELARTLPGLALEAEGAAREYAAMKAAGAELHTLDAFAVVRARAIAGKVETEIRRIMERLSTSLTAAEEETIRLGFLAARQLVQTALPADIPPDLAARVGESWQTPPIAAARQAIAAQSGGPLRNLFDAMGRDAGQRARTRIVQGILAGSPPSVVGNAIRETTGIAGSRAQTIARTETLRAYRESSRLAWQQNGVVMRYKRLAAHSNRTCVMCLALDGKVQETDELLAVHPNDRCAVVPIVDLSDFGIASDTEAESSRETGAAWFARQDAATQRAILGPGGYSRYQQGAALSAFVRVRHDREWGPTLERVPNGEVG